MTDETHVQVPTIRPRRLRRTPALRRMVAEHHVVPSSLVLPVFIREGLDEPRPITSMPGVVQHSRDSLKQAVSEAAELGLGGVMLFGIPAEKDAVESFRRDVVEPSSSGGLDLDGHLSKLCRMPLSSLPAHASFSSRRLNRVNDIRARILFTRLAA